MKVYLDANCIIKLPDALHLATAIESGCGLFLTKRPRINNFYSFSSCPSRASAQNVEQKIAKKGKAGTRRTPAKEMLCRIMRSC